jgi:WD40 repeat protein
MSMKTRVVALVVGSILFGLAGAAQAQPDRADAPPLVCAEQVVSFKHGWDGVHSVALSPDGKRIVAGTGGAYTSRSAIGVWEADTGKQLLKIDTKRYLKAVALSPNGKHIASGGRDRLLRTDPSDPVATVWDARTGEALLNLKEHAAAVTSIDYSADGKRIVTAGGDHSNLSLPDRSPNKAHRGWDIKLWDAATGKRLLDLKGPGMYVTKARISADGKRIVSSANPTVTVWDVDTGKELLVLKNAASYSLAISPDGRQIVLGDHPTHTVRLWDVASGKEVRKLHNNSVYDVTFSRDGKWIVGTTAVNILIWDVATGRELLSQKVEDVVGQVYRVALSADGRRLVGSSDFNLTVWNLKPER